MFKFSDYTIIKKLGSGATSDVYLAETKAGEKRALKAFNQMLPIKQGDITFQRELDNLNALRSERIVKVYGLEKNSNDLWVLIQEYIDGVNLSQVLQTKHHPVDRVILCLIVASEVLYALEESHSKGIIHRDIKPENILLENQGRIVLTDFGLSKNTNINQLTLHGQLFGSPQYMSLDQFSKKEVNDKFDLYSVAVLMYEMLTSTTPYQGDNIEEILNAKRNGHFKSIEKLNPYTPVTLKNILKDILTNKFEDKTNKAYKLRFEILNILNDYNLNTPIILKRICEQKTILSDDEKKTCKKIILAELTTNYDQLKKGPHKNVLLGQILKIDNNNSRGGSKSLFASRKFMTRAIGLISLITLAYFLYTNQKSELTTAPTQISNAEVITINNKSKLTENVSPTKENQDDIVIKAPQDTKNPQTIIEDTNKAIVDKKVKLSRAKKILRKQKRKPKTIKPKLIKSNGFLIVNVPSDIQVLVNNKRIISIGKRLGYLPGKYNIQLKKNGHPTMKSTIEITAGKDTLINLD